MSIKGKEVNVNDMEVPNEDPSFRISMVNLSQRDDFQSRDHVSRHHPDLMRRKTNKFTVEHFQDKNFKTRHMDDIDTEKQKTTITEKNIQSIHSRQKEESARLKN